MTPLMVVVVVVLSAISLSKTYPNWVTHNTDIVVVVDLCVSSGAVVAIIIKHNSHNAIRFYISVTLSLSVVYLCQPPHNKTINSLTLTHELDGSPPQSVTFAVI